MNNILKTFLSLSVSGSLLILLLFLCKQFLKDTISRQWQYYIWLIIITRLLFPLAHKTNLVGNVFQTIDHSVIQTNIRLPFKQDKSDLPNIDNTEQENDKNRKETKIPLYNQLIRLIQNVITLLADNLGLIWLIIACFLFMRKIVIYQSFIRYVKAGQIPVSDTKFLDKLVVIGKQAKVTKPIELCINPLISSPLLIGFFHPCIVLPTINISERDFCYIVLHELTHYHRKDMFYKWLVQFTICLHWFNPLVYLMGQEINKACEFSCDEAIISKMASCNKKEYADTLLNAMKTAGNYKEILVSMTLNENKQLLKERLTAIMRFKKKTRLIGMVSIILAFLLCFGGAAAGAYVVSPKETLKQQTAITSNSINSKTKPTDFVIECTSEKIIVKQGGTKFKVEVDPISKENYIIRDNTNVPYKDRYYKYNKWDIIVERKKELSPSAVLSSAITLTIPYNIDRPALYLHTSSGNIYVEKLNNVNLTAESQDGNIYINNTAAEFISAVSYNKNIKLANVTCANNIELYSNKGLVTAQLGDSSSHYSIKVDTTSKANITINNKHYNGGNYTIGNGEKPTITLKGGNNSFQISNVVFLKSNYTANKTKNTNKEQFKEESYWTEKDFLNFMQKQRQKYKELLTNGDITKEEFHTYISTDKETLKEIQNGEKIPKSAIGNIENSIQ